MHPLAPRTVAALVAAAAGLGRVRIMLRSCGGFAEVFCAAGALRTAGEWVHLQEPGVHLHVPIATLTGASFHEAGGDAHPARPSVWLHGRSGAPVLLLFLDQTSGAEWTGQEASFRDLRARWGAEVRFAPALPVHGDETRERVLH
jgi:hypothetical protein